MTAIFLAKAGLWLFLAGLLIGAAIPKFTSPRLALSAHLTAVQSGTALLAIGWFWPQLTQGIPMLKFWAMRFGFPSGCSVRASPLQQLGAQAECCRLPELGIRRRH